LGVPRFRLPSVARSERRWRSIGYGQLEPSPLLRLTPEALPGVSGVTALEYLGFLKSLGYRFSVVTSEGLEACGVDTEKVLSVCRARNADHIDVFAEPA
jgi:hypothetical protein